MKRMLLVCRNCHYEGRIEELTWEEFERNPQPTQPARCPRCGSGTVSLHE
jgi:hypothetical protein